VATLIWNVAGIVVLAIAAIAAPSVPLAGVGLESIIEIGVSRQARPFGNECGRGHSAASTDQRADPSDWLRPRAITGQEWPAQGVFPTAR
jgi:hypothetical protein